MAGFGSASLMVKIALILTIVGFIVYLIGFSTPYWISSSTLIGDYHQGLWQGCSPGSGCGSIDASRDSTYQAAQAFAVLGFLGSLASIVCIILYIFVEQTSTKIVFMIAMIANFVTAGLILLAVIIYGAHIENNLSWSFAFSIIAAIIHGVAGVLLVVDMVKR